MLLELLLCGRSRRWAVGLQCVEDWSMVPDEFTWGSSEGRDDSGTAESLVCTEFGDRAAATAAADGSIWVVETGVFPK